MIRFILALMKVVFHFLGYVVLLWRHQDDPASVLGYASILAGCLLDLPKHWPPNNEEDGSNNTM